MRKYIIILIILIGISANTVKADEGMWLIQALNNELQKRMETRGLEIGSEVIYSENEASLKDAVVSLDFGCTGSMISNKGLLITNHHCAYDDIFNLSTPENNLLENGYWAKNSSEEIPVKGKTIYFLRKVVDCTNEVNHVRDSLQKIKQPSGSRRVFSIIENKHKQQSGYEASCSSMWNGNKYYMYYYDTYTDIRFVGAPPVQVAAFGGDVDNWEWPQHKCDFALYRIYGDKNGRPAAYSDENIPIKPKKILKISLDGVQENDFAMIIGFPGRTDRYSSSFKVDMNERIIGPIMVESMGTKMEIIRKWMNRDSEIRKKYSNIFFGLSNVQESLAGEVACTRRFDVVEKKRQEENKYWKNDASLLSMMERGYKDVEEIEKYMTYYRQSLVSGKGFIALGNSVNSLKPDDNQSYDSFVKRVEKLFTEYDARVEKELMEYQLRLFIENVPEKYWGPFIKYLTGKFEDNYAAMTSEIFDNSVMLDPNRFKEAAKEKNNIKLFMEDPAAKLARDIKISDLRKDETQILKGKVSLYKMDGLYEKALYNKKKSAGILQYPDANFTMRLTYGNVCKMQPSDAINYNYISTTQGIIDKYNPYDYDFAYPENILNIIKRGEWGKYGKDGKLHVNFLTNNDITGGNSGSPVMNGKGELIGLAFDGNKESLASKYYYQDEMTNCVSVDIRYVLWYIDNCTDVGYLLDEIEFAE